MLHVHVLILSVISVYTQSQETFQCPLLVCHGEIALQLDVHQLLLFSIEMLIYFQNILFLLLMYYSSCCIRNIL
jgi:hypothetical protein